MRDRHNANSHGPEDVMRESIDSWMQVDAVGCMVRGQSPLVVSQIVATRMVRWLVNWSKLSIGQVVGRLWQVWLEG